MDEKKSSGCFQRRGSICSGGDYHVSDSIDIEFTSGENGNNIVH